MKFQKHKYSMPQQVSIPSRDWKCMLKVEFELDAYRKLKNFRSWKKMTLLGPKYFMVSVERHFFLNEVVELQKYFIM